MPQFIRLPSGLVVNRSLITQMMSTVEHGTASVTVHFSGGDVAVLTPEDAAVLRKRLGSTTSLSSGVMIGFFWVVIIAAVALVYLSVRR